MVALILIFLHSDVPLFLHIPDKLLLVPFPFGEKDKAAKDALVIGLGFFIRCILIVVGIIVRIQIIGGLVYQATDELLKAVRQRVIL